MKILTVGQQHSGVSYHRLFNPMMYMEKEYCMMSDMLKEEELEKGFDIVYINRFIPNLSIEEITDLRKKYGFKLIVDADDFWHLDPWHILYGKYNSKKVVDHIKAADLVTCTNLELYTEIKQLNKNVHIIPNALPYGSGQFVADKTNSELVRFVYAGSITHEKDLTLLKNPLKKVASDSYLHNKTQFILCGYDSDNPYTQQIWGRMINDYTVAFKLNAYIRASLPVTEYMNFYNEADVCLVPLVSSTFNSMKSNLKVLEAAAKNAHVIASNVKPYSNCPHIAKVSKQTEWFSEIKKAVKDSIYRLEQGQINGEYCRENFDLIKVNKLRKQIFESCL